jgi:hypothetical protein
MSNQIPRKKSKQKSSTSWEVLSPLRFLNSMFVLTCVHQSSCIEPSNDLSALASGKFLVQLLLLFPFLPSSTQVARRPQIQNL